VARAATGSGIFFDTARRLLLVKLNNNLAYALHRVTTAVSPVLPTSSEDVMVVTLTDLQPLFDQPAGAGMVLSCFTTLSGTDGFGSGWTGPFREKQDVHNRDTYGDPDAQRELDDNLSAVRTGFEALGDIGARWAAVFSSARRGLFHAFALDVPVEPDVVCAPSAYLVPVLAAIHRRREYLAVHTDTHRGRVYASTPAGVKVLAEDDEEVPQHQRSTGDRGGYGQATIARHRQDRILHYRKELVRSLERSWDAGRYAGLILLGEHEELAHLRTALPARLAERVVRTAPEPWYEGATRAEDKVRTLAAEVLAEDEAAVAPGFWDLLREGTVVAGAPAVWDVLQRGRIARAGHGYLVFGPDPRETVSRCTLCRALDPAVSGRCPRCQAPCVTGNLWEEVLLCTLKHGIVARFVSDPAALKRYGGIVAVPAKNGGV
jgi:hypothetical protein